MDEIHYKYPCLVKQRETKASLEGPYKKKQTGLRRVGARNREGSEFKGFT